MSGFEPGWLALREAADERSRNRGVREAARRHFAGRSALNVVDLGCGTGSNFRAIQSLLPAQQEWRLVDHDSGLLAAARHSMVKFGPTPLTTLKFLLTDIATDIEQLIDDSTDLVTAAALFDLVSADWLARFTKALAVRSLPLYAALTYNGCSNWFPHHSDDAEILAAFHLHQRRNKGFGPAAGPEAASILCELLRAQGYQIVVGDSSWKLTSADAALIARLVDGIGEAVTHTNRVVPQQIEGWCNARLRNSSCEIGHVDLFAHRAAV
jgi:hypothetical protein